MSPFKSSSFSNHPLTGKYSTYKLSCWTSNSINKCVEHDANILDTNRKASFVQNNDLTSISSLTQSRLFNSSQKCLQSIYHTKIPLHVSTKFLPNSIHLLTISFCFLPEEQTTPDQPRLDTKPPLLHQQYRNNTR
mgnify:CR=1 FL=1